MNPVLLLFTTLLTGAPDDNNDLPKPDPCAGVLPAEAQATLPKGARLPLPNELIQPHTGCYAVSNGDFNGDGFKDFLLVLRTEEDDWSVAVALAKHGAYELSILLPHQYGDGEVSIAVERPGTVHRHDKSCGPFRRGGGPNSSKREVSKHDMFCVEVALELSAMHCERESGGPSIHTVGADVDGDGGGPAHVSGKAWRVAVRQPWSTGRS